MFLKYRIPSYQIKIKVHKYNMICFFLKFSIIVLIPKYFSLFSPRKTSYTGRARQK